MTVARTPAAVARAVTKGPLSSAMPSAVRQAVLRCMATSLAPSLDPMVRRVRRTQETSRIRLFKDLVYFGLVVCCLPFTLIEGACRAGSTVMVEARKKV